MNDRRSIAVRQFVAWSLAVFAALYVVAHCGGCGIWGARAVAAVETAAYERDLDSCLVEGRRAHSLAVYEQCANEMDIKHGVSRDAGKE